MRSHFMLNSGVAMACAAGAASLVSNTADAQIVTAADYATNSAYANGWQEADNGGFGFSAWNFYGTSTNSSPIQNGMDTNSIYNQLGISWTLFNPAGTIPDSSPDSPNGDNGTDLSIAGRGFAPLQVGQTISTVFENPTERTFFRGYTIRLVSGGKNVVYGGTGALERFAFYAFSYFDNGRWYSTGGATSLIDSNTAAGARLDVTLVTTNYYKTTVTPLNNPGLAYTKVGALGNSGPIDWIQFDFYNTDSDFHPDVASNPQPTDFYIRSITINSNQPVPAFLSQPQPAARYLYPGRTSRFHASAVGVSISYQWRKDGVNLSDGGNISGALTDTLVINNVGPGDVAAYTLVVTDTTGGGSVTSSPPTTLSLVPPPAGTPYEDAVLAANPIAHWRLNETANPATNPPAYDYAGGLAGTYESASSNGFNSITGPRPPGWPGFESSNYALKSTGDSNLSWVTIPPLNLNTDTVTLTAWINPAGPQADYTGVLYTRNDGLAEGINYGGDFTTNAGQLAYTWNNNSQDTYGFASGLEPPTNQWSFIALVIDPAKAIFYLSKTNGLSSATNAIPHTVEPWAGSGTIGGDPGNSVGRTFDGRIDEVAVFNRALSFAEIQTLYNAAKKVTLKIARSGSNIVLTWPVGTLLEATDIGGPWQTNSVSSPYTNAPTGSRKFYKTVQ